MDVHVLYETERNGLMGQPTHGKLRTFTTLNVDFTTLGHLVVG